MTLEQAKEILKTSPKTAQEAEQFKKALEMVLKSSLKKQN